MGGDHYGHADLSHGRIGAGYDGHLGNLRVGAQHRLDLHRVHVVAPADVQLLDTPR